MNQILFSPKTLFANILSLLRARGILILLTWSFASFGATA